MQPEIVQAVGERWVWILDIVFSSVIGFGFQKLEEGLRLTARSSVSAFMKHLFMAAGFLGFVIYDIGVYHILIKNFPYDVSSLSAARYVLDLIMAFLLMVILVRGLSIDAGKHVFEILIALSLWHIAAMCWHFAASMQRNGVMPDVNTFSPHVAFIAMYWLTFALWYFPNGEDRQSKLAEPTGFRVFLAAALLLISIWRSHQMIQKFVSEPTHDHTRQASLSMTPAGPGQPDDSLPSISSLPPGPAHCSKHAAVPGMNLHRLLLDLNTGLKGEFLAYSR